MAPGRGYWLLALLTLVLSGCGVKVQKPSSETVPSSKSELMEFASTLKTPLDTLPVIEILGTASRDQKSLDAFAALAKDVWNDPNGPLRNDEMYAQVLKAQIASGFYDDLETMRLRFALDKVSQNRLLHKANDFAYTLMDGTTHRLYDLKVKGFILVFINNPGCEMCQGVTKDLKASEVVSKLMEAGYLTILSIYPDEDVELWKTHISEQPESWIRSYDKGCQMLEYSSYNLDAIPSMYLLREDKTVVIKDFTDVSLMEAWFMSVYG